MSPIIDILTMCVAMLLGTTFAWFTDTVTSGTNTIVAGNLDVELEYSKNGTDWDLVQGTTDLFSDVTLWEPGATSVVYLKLTNKGTLALKYNLAITATGGDFTNAAGEAKNLKDALKFAQVAGPNLVTYATREEAVAATNSVATGLNNYAQANHMSAGQVSYITLVVTMPTDIGNEFNYKTDTTAPEIRLGITLNATQYTYESDSFDKYYDVTATPIDVYTAEEFTEAVAKAKAGVNTEITVKTPGLTLTVAYEDAKTITLKGEKITKLTANIPNGTIHVYNEVTTVVGTNVDLQNSAHFYNKITTLNATAGHFVVEAGAVAGTINTPETVEKDLKIEIKGAVDEITVPKADTKVVVKVEENATVNALNIADNAEGAKIVLQNEGTIGNEAAIAEKTQAVAEMDKEEKTLTIKDADELRAFAKSIDKYMDYTVTLANDIDLANKAWTPIVLAAGGMWNEGKHTLTINGNNKTISNMTIPAGENYGFIGYTSAAKVTISNLTFEKPVIDVSTGTGYGVVIGRLVGSGELTNVDVNNAKIAGGFENKVIRLGGLIGVAEVDDGNFKTLTLTDCDVANSTIEGFHNVGGFIGTVQTKGNVNKITATNCTLKNCQLFGGDARSEAALAGCVHKIANDSYAEVDIAGITCENVTLFVKAAPGVVYANNTYTISSAEGLVWFAEKVNAGTSFEGKTVKLANDVDLKDVAWTPIGNVTSYPSVSFYGTFDGQNHTISNLTCTDTLQNNATAGLFGSLMGTVKNVNLKNVNITSAHYAGGIVGYSSSSGSKVINCSVDGGTITSTPELINEAYDNGDKAGGIFGLNSEGGEITGCTVSNLTIRAFRDVGGIVGASKGNVTNNTIGENVVIEYVEVTPYAGHDNENMGDYVGRDLGDVDMTGCTGKATKHGKTITVVPEEGQTAQAAVESAIASAGAGDTIVLPKDSEVNLTTISLDSKELKLKGDITTVVSIAPSGQTFGSGSKVNFEGITVRGVVGGSYGYKGLNSSTATYTDCTFSGCTTLYGESVTFNNCTFNQNYYEYSVYTYGAKVATFNNCKFYSVGKALKAYCGGNTTVVNVNNCEFYINGTAAASANKPAIAIDTDTGNCGITVNVKGCTQCGYQSSGDSDMTYINNEALVGFDTIDSSRIKINLNDKQVQPAN